MPLFAYGASRLIGEGALSQSMPEFPAASLFDDDAHLVNAEEWLLRTDYVEQGQSKKNGERKTQKVIGLLLELFAGEVKEIKIDKEDGNPKVLFLTQFGWVRLHNLSLGYKSLIAWMVDLAARMMERYPDSKKPLEEPAIVLVDEIDLHLHPSFQRRLTGWLSGIFKKTQFIVTAHSPLVAQAGAEANIILLTRENDTVRVSQNPVDIRQWRIDQILTSDLFGLSSPHSQSTEAMLSERRSILEKAAPKAAESKKLKNLDAEIEKMPIGDTQSEIEGFELMKEFARQLSAKKQRGEL
jgi:predicted ATP-binding protein involved in virulence